MTKYFAATTATVSTSASLTCARHALGEFTDLAEDMLAADLRPTSRVVHFAEEVTAPAIVAELGLVAGGTVVRVDRLRLADGRPLAFDRTYLPPRYGHLLDRSALESETILARLEQRYAIPIVAGRYTIEATVAAEPLATCPGRLLYPG